MVDDSAKNVLESVYRSNSRKLFARLVRVIGDFDLAEDALQDAVFSAAAQWPTDGVPNNPSAWLFTVARNRAIDSLRRSKRLTPLTDSYIEPSEEPEELGDELLRLVFTCCHPTISPDAQVALTLREVCELTTEQIGHAFLTPATTIAQRIVRAKAKIRQAAIPFDIPSREELPSRLDAVLKTIYLVFNEGYSSSSGEQMMRPELMSMAIYIARQLNKLMPDPEINGLLALMLLHQARSITRVTPAGDIVRLENQDRSLWNHETIRQAGKLVSDSLRSGRYGVYTLQAAIAAIHAEAGSFAETDWNQIIGLYDALIRLDENPIVELNRAIAVAMRDGSAAGISLIDQLLSTGELAQYHLAYAARADLHARQGDSDRARIDYETALRLASQEPEQRLIQKSLDEIS